MKISVIGAGNVGATIAQLLAYQSPEELALIDIYGGVAQGKALDLMESAPVLNFHTHIAAGSDYALIDGSDIVVVTAGFPRMPGMSRDDLLEKNVAVLKEVSANIKTHAPEAIVIVVTNPLDVMSYVALKITGLPRRKVIGMAGILDSARFRAFIAMELGVHPYQINAMVLGGHGDSMVPLARLTTINGVPITKLMPQDKIGEIITRTQKGGGEIVGLLGKGSAFYAPAASAYEMVVAITNDQKKILPCSVYTRGEYGIENIFVGLPVKLGKEGVEKIIELDLTKEELALLQSSAAKVKKITDKIEL